MESMRFSSSDLHHIDLTIRVSSAQVKDPQTCFFLRISFMFGEKQDCEESILQNGPSPFGLTTHEECGLETAQTESVREN
jgi:hypothetical protein